MNKQTKIMIAIGSVITITAIIILTGKKAAASIIGDVASYDDLLPIVNKYSSAYGVPQALIYAIMQQESRDKYLGTEYFDTNATLMKNPTEIAAGGSQGLMQILLSSAHNLGYTGDAAGLYDPDTGIKYGVLYIKYIHNHFRVDYSDVGDIAAYYNDNKPYTSAISSTQQTYVPNVLKYYSYFSDLLLQDGISSPQAQPLSLLTGTITTSSTGLWNSLISML